MEDLRTHKHTEGEDRVKMGSETQSASHWDEEKKQLLRFVQSSTRTEFKSSWWRNRFGSLLSIVWRAEVQVKMLADPQRNVVSSTHTVNLNQVRLSSWKQTWIWTSALSARKINILLYGFKEEDEEGKRDISKREEEHRLFPLWLNYHKVFSKPRRQLQKNTCSLRKLWWNNRFIN